MAQGGKRPGAGRPKGLRNRKTVAAVEEIAKTGETPLQYMLRVMRDPKQSAERRDWAAEKAAPYVHAKLQSIEGVPDKPIEFVDKTSERERIRRIAFLLATAAQEEA